MLSTIALDTQVIRPGLCTGCGACQGMCPYWDSVEGRTICYFDCERPDGRCQRFCPRMPTDLDALRQQFFPADTIIPEIGPFRGLYLTRAADPTIRANAQHGGTMTALVELAIQEGFIDAAVMTMKLQLISLCISMASSGSIRCTFRSPSRMPWDFIRLMMARFL